MNTVYTKQPKIGYGLTKGQMEVIKMQVFRFNARYTDVAKHYGVTLNAIRQICDTKQFADIQPLGGYLDKEGL